MIEHLVRVGDCLSSIAREHKTTWRALWEHASNADLKRDRVDPNVLMPGDVVRVPPIRPAEFDRPTTARHRFVRKGVPTRLGLRLVTGDAPRANERYALEIDGQPAGEGTLDGDGGLSVPIPCGARAGRVFVGDDRDEFAFELGALRPIRSAHGLQTRLNNLGFHCGPVDGVVGPRTRAAIARFHAASGGAVADDDPDADLIRDALRDAHGA